MYLYIILVLSWDGEASAVSKDAAEDTRHAKCDTVIDEWDEEFDRGKVNTIRMCKYMYSTYWFGSILTGNLCTGEKGEKL